MQEYDIIIIGSGLGGLLTGTILSKEGYNVCILEKNSVIGGCLQSFARDGVVFNTGLNYTESLDKSQVLYQYFKYAGVLDDLKLRRMDIDGFEKISFSGDDRVYTYAQGEDRFIDTLAACFPAERGSIEAYMGELHRLSHSFPLYDLEIKPGNNSLNDYYYTNTKRYLESVTNDKRLRNVLAATNPLYAGIAKKTPLYIHGIINFSFIKSAWRLIDGSSQLAKLLARSIYASGGSIYRRKRVEKILVRDKLASGVLTDDGTVFRAKHIISNIHPALTMEMLDNTATKNAYSRRIMGMDNTIGMFTLYAVLKTGTQPYMNFNIYHYTSDDVWQGYDYNEDGWPPYIMAYTPAVSHGDDFADALIMITYMRYEEVKRWGHTRVENRGPDYLEFKHRKAEKMIDAIEERLPGIRSRIDKYYTSTPLTYRDYTGTKEGSSYGIIKDCNDPLRSLLMPKTRIPNLYLTGQNLNLHGILGVSVNALLTCSEFLGMEYLIDKVKNADK